MKRLMLLLLGVFLMGAPMLRAQSEASTKKVAILEVVDRDNAINYGVKLLLRTTLAKAITQTQGYEGYDRVDMVAIQGEQDFQRTGMVSDEQIKRLGEMTGAAYVLVAEAAKIDATNMIVTAKILDVETAKLERTDYEQMGMSAKEMAEGCRTMAGRLFASPEGDKVKAEAIPQMKKQKESKYKEDTATEYHPSGRIVFKGGMLQDMVAYGFTSKLSKTQTKLYLGNWYKDYQKAVAGRWVGISCMVTGGGAVVSGVSMVLCNVLEKEKFRNPDFYEVNRGNYGYIPYQAYYYKEHHHAIYLTGGIIVASVGAALLVAGVPTYTIANKKIRRILQIAEETNMAPPYKTACTFNFNTQHGVGVNITF